MKKILAVLWVLALLVPLACCGAQETENKEEAETSSSKWEVSEQEEKTEMIAFDKDAEEMQDPLVICMDLEYAGRNRYTDASVIVNDFLMTLEQTGGLADVKVEYLPASGAERESMLSRLRVELMAGKGPDVFIVNGRGALGSGAQESEALFTMPQKHMETGLFLPLDDYMENHTEYAEWDKFPEGVMAAGRNAEGQQIIPMSY